jgi:hypothetical protein
MVAMQTRARRSLGDRGGVGLKSVKSANSSMHSWRITVEYHVGEII